MNGQWHGKFEGTNKGTLTIDLDDRRDHFEGYVYAWNDDRAIPSTFARIKTQDKSKSFKQTLIISPIDPRNGNATTSEEISKLFPNVTHGKTAEVSVEQDGDSLKVDWKTDINTNGTAILPRSRAGKVTEYLPIPEVQSWKQFKDFATAQEPRRYIYRGQRELNRLRTSFHRTGRADLHTFLNIDRTALFRHLSSRTRHIFDLDTPDQNGAFLNLIQHHGYPTPILDWTYSPFVSAFFAYRNLPLELETDQKVRVFVFDQKEWCAKVKPQMKGLIGRPHFSVIEFVAMENERMVPQQSISTVTNIDDIETYIHSYETADTKFLKIIDLPLNERSVVMDELSLMGITAGSMFPGLDGACEELRERFFYGNGITSQMRD